MSNGENDDDDDEASLLVFWPHVHAGAIYFDRDGELLKMYVGEKKNDDDEGEISRKVFFKEYERRCQKKRKWECSEVTFITRKEKRSSRFYRFSRARECA